MISRVLGPFDLSVVYLTTDAMPSGRTSQAGGAEARARSRAGIALAPVAICGFAAIQRLRIGSPFGDHTRRRPPT